MDRKMMVRERETDRQRGREGEKRNEHIVVCIHVDSDG